MAYENVCECCVNVVCVMFSLKGAKGETHI